MVTGVYPTKRGVLALPTVNLTSFLVYFTRDQVLLFLSFPYPTGVGELY